MRRSSAAKVTRRTQEGRENEWEEEGAGVKKIKKKLTRGFHNWNFHIDEACHHDRAFSRYVYISLFIFFRDRAFLNKRRLSFFIFSITLFSLS
jgi:hypothetical protein